VSKNAHQAQRFPSERYAKRYYSLLCWKTQNCPKGMTIIGMTNPTFFNSFQIEEVWHRNWPYSSPLTLRPLRLERSGR